MNFFRCRLENRKKASRLCRNVPTADPAAAYSFPFRRTSCRTGAYSVREEVLHMGVSRTRRGHNSGRQEPFIRYPGTCTAVFGSMTQTLHAQSVLAAASIRTAVTKVSSAQTHGGCAYGLTFPCMQEGNVRQVLATAGIRARRMPGES